LTLPSTCEIVRGVATITLDHEEKRNALSTEMLDSLGDHLSNAGADDSVRAVVLTHTGSTFCAGADLSVAGRTTARYDIAGLLALIQDLPKPVVAKIAGQSLGGGVGLAAACDVSIATVDSRFGFSEIRLGVAPAVISVVCLPKMRRRDAAELFLSGERFDAIRAEEVGLITRAVEAADLDPAVDSFLDLIRLGGPRAQAAVKRILAAVPGMHRDEAFAWAAGLSAELFGSEESTEGIAAFRERRPARWVGSD
jgi:methylglutaconyl-CoA hydratase